MKNNNILYYFIVAVIVGVAAFYGQNTKSLQTNLLQGGQGGSQQGGRQRSGGSFGGAAGNAVSGQVIAKDDKSITIQLRNGGSQFVFFSPTTSILKTSAGSNTDLANGINVVVTGTTSTDGSVTASMIQIRPAGMFPGSTQQQKAPAATAPSGA